MLILLRYGFAVDPWSTAKLVADTLFSTVVAIGVPWLLGIAVGQLPAVLAGQPATGLLVSAIAIVVLLIAETVVSSAQLTTFEDLSLRTERNVLTRLTRLCLDPVRVDHLQDADFGDRTQRARDLVWQIDQGLFSMARPAGELLTLVGATVLLGVSVGWPGAAVLAVATVAVGVLRMRLADREMDVWFGHTEDQRHADYAFGLGTGLAPAEVRIFGLQRWVGQRFWGYLTAAWVGYWRQGVTSSLWILAADLVRVVLAIGVIGLIVRSALAGELSLAAATAGVPLVLVLVDREIGSLELTRRGTIVLADMQETERRYGVPRAAPDVLPPDALPPDALPARAARAGSAPTIRFEDVGYTYPDASSPALVGLTLELRAGASIAVVGVNGAGKSTLIRLLSGALRPDSGRILVDGIDLTAIDDDGARGWQRRVALLTQEFCRYPLSARDNVALGVGRLDVDLAEIEAAGRRSGADTIVARSRAGWDTVLDASFTDGQDLSGGEWQRIALARARLAVARGADVLVLDEPAAALDVRSEAALVERHLELAQGLTSVVVSHRFSVVRPVPRIVVIDGGRVVEDGTHADLMAANGRYASMFSVQANRVLRDDEGTGVEP